MNTCNKGEGEGPLFTLTLTLKRAELMFQRDIVAIEQNMKNATKQCIYKTECSSFHHTDQTIFQALSQYQEYLKD